MYPRFNNFACVPKTPSWLAATTISRSEGRAPSRKTSNGRDVIVNHPGI